eukprot:TRINITY_DN42208_c0_g1_i1.p1 TRINITY_DN42208_c0_g1~~TRINITY_DN42208_c0_g1_i1.p1  ORF type:complete len:1403 (-),score=410.50 TRINITY_DN42208_c0_g1_i1:521-4729(-)
MLWVGLFWLPEHDLAGRPAARLLAPAGRHLHSRHFGAPPRRGWHRAGAATAAPSRRWPTLEARTQGGEPDTASPPHKKKADWLVLAGTAACVATAVVGRRRQAVTGGFLCLGSSGAAVRQSRSQDRNATAPVRWCRKPAVQRCGQGFSTSPPKRKVSKSAKGVASKKNPLFAKDKKSRPKKQQAEPPPEEETTHVDPNQRDPMSVAHHGLEDEIWAEARVRSAIKALCKAADKLTLQRIATALMHTLMERYASLATCSQLSSALESLDYHVNGYDEQSSDYLALEEPLSWRPLQAAQPLRAFSLDLFAWRFSAQGRKKAAQKDTTRGRGFGKESEHDPLAIAVLEPHDDDFHWMVIDGFLSVLKNNQAKPRLRIPRLVMKASFVQRLQKQGIEVEKDGYELWQIEEQLRWKDVATADNSIVVVVEADGSPLVGDQSWALCLEEPTTGGSADVHAKTAPIVVLNLLQFGVKFTGATLATRIMRVCERFLDEDQLIALEDEPEPATQAEKADLSNFMTAIVSAVQDQLSKKDKNDDVMRTLGDELRAYLSPVVRKMYGNRWRELQDTRVPELQSAKTELDAARQRREDLDRRAQQARQRLDAARAALQRESFEKEAEQARAAGVLSQEDLAAARRAFEGDLSQAGTPLRDMLNNWLAHGDFSSSAESDARTRAEWEAHLQMAAAVASGAAAKELDAKLAGTKLPASDSLRQAAEAMADAIKACCELAAVASGGMARRGDLAGRLAYAVSSVNSFELKGEQALGGGKRTAPALQEMLVEGRGALKQAKQDEALEAYLYNSIWKRIPLSLDDITDEESATLDRFVAAASEHSRSRLGDDLESALVACRCASSLRSAMESSDCVQLADCIAEGKRLNLQGLDAAVARLDTLEHVLPRVRSQLEDAIEALNEEQFQQVLEDEAEEGLPGAEVLLLQKRLGERIEAAEEAVKSPLVEEPLSRTDIEAAARASRLPEDNVWRRLACRAAEALKAEASLPQAATSVAELTVAIEKSRTASVQLKTRIQALGNPTRWPGPVSRLQERVDKAVDEHKGVLRGMQGDVALGRLLTSTPFDREQVQFKDVKLSDSERLQRAAANATPKGREQHAERLTVVKKICWTANKLRTAMAGKDPNLVGACILEARDAGLGGLEIARTRRRELEVKAQSERALKTMQELEPSMEESVSSKWLARSAATRHMPPQPTDAFSNIVFLDLELTAGFYDFDLMPKVLEAAIIIVDPELREVDRGSWVVGGFNETDLERLGSFHQVQFRDAKPGGAFPPLVEAEGGNGLFTDVLSSTQRVDDVADEMLRLVRRHCPLGTCPLAGYSVQCDREVLKAEMPHLYKHFSHRIVDVSSVFQMARMWAPERLAGWDNRSTSRYSHRAMDDAEESLEALRWVRTNIFKEGKF